MSAKSVRPASVSCSSAERRSFAVDLVLPDGDHLADLLLAGLVRAGALLLVEPALAGLELVARHLHARDDAVVVLALLLRDRDRQALDALQLDSFVKTSGADGIHVLVPIARRATYEQTYAFAERVARARRRRT